MPLRRFSTERIPLYLKKSSFGLISWSFEIVDRRTILIITLKIDHRHAPSSLAPALASAPPTPPLFHARATAIAATRGCASSRRAVWPSLKQMGGGCDTVSVEVKASSFQLTPHNIQDRRKGHRRKCWRKRHLLWLWLLCGGGENFLILSHSTSSGIDSGMWARYRQKAVERRERRPVKGS